ncbi:hypothetical protein [Kitasatospora sp. NPDC002040]|uniref:hypothetical protein n=1 Tax=Kitasatospora sp. NPDC002040 TaxID=3154661 RepID=UPI0033262238
MLWTGLVALALAAAACDPAPSGPATPPSPSVAEATESPTPTPTRTGTPARSVVPAPAPTTATASPTTADPTRGGTCARHTTGECGWDHGLTPTVPGQTAVCRNGDISDAANFRGTCSKNGGVRYWFR